MKFNLKNRPDSINYQEDEGAESYIIDAEGWFEGFEKELRDKLELALSSRWKNVSDWRTLKEILGDGT